MATIPELAPDLVAAGLTAKELRRALRPREAAPKPVKPAVTVQPKRWKMSFDAVVAGKTDEQVCKECCVPQEIVDKVRAQVAAVRAKLANLEPVAHDAPEVPVPGDPDYVEPPPDPVPVKEPVVAPKAKDLDVN